MYNIQLLEKGYVRQTNPEWDEISWLIEKMLCVELTILEIRLSLLGRLRVLWFLCLLVSHGWNEGLKSHTVCHVVYVNAVATAYDAHVLLLFVLLIHSVTVTSLTSGAVKAVGSCWHYRGNQRHHCRLACWLLNSWGRRDVRRCTLHA